MAKNTMNASKQAGRKWTGRTSVMIMLMALLAIILQIGMMPSNVFAATSVSYIERSWDGSKVVSTTKTVSATSLNDADISSLDGWYVADSSKEYNDETRLEVKGTVNLIICDGVTITCKNGIHVSSGSTLNIYGQSGDSGKLEAKSYDNYKAAIGGDDQESGGTVAVHGGKVTADAKDKGQEAAGIGGGEEGGAGSFTIYGGEVTAYGTNYAAGIGTGDVDDGGKDGGTVKIYGGKVTAEGGNDSAGIGGGEGASGADVEIYGGTVNATGGSYKSDGGAGIGSGEEDLNTVDAGTVKIYGGNVTATGGTDGAGIGGGNSVDGGTIEIHGGTVRASTPHDRDRMSYGAGIGGGDEGNGGTIRIYGGDVEAKGGVDGAGIGGGHKGNGGDIEIRNGKVKATGDGESLGGVSGGAGIGGGHKGNGGTIKISGGNVEATGGMIGAGIGGGSKADCGIIDISGGTVKAVGGEYKSGGSKDTDGQGGPGIGNGAKNDGDTTQKITITGGSITAQGKYGGSGIGTGYEGENKNLSITISDCNKIDARGGDGAAGIGGCIYDNGGNITIKGGHNISAGGGGGAAGIGGGRGKSGGNIKISGGEIRSSGGTAVGGQAGAGIGGGVAAGSGKIEISGGTVEANGANNGGAGIGSGACCENDEDAIDVTISGGTVVAKGGDGLVYGDTGGHWTYYPGAAIGAGGYQYRNNGGDVESYFSGNIYLNGGNIIVRPCGVSQLKTSEWHEFDENHSNYFNLIGITTDKDQEDVTGNVYFNGATVTMNNGKGRDGSYAQPVRATNVNISDSNIHQIVSYRENEGDELTAVNKDDRISTLSQTGKHQMIVKRCMHEDNSYVDNGSDHNWACAHCGTAGAEPHEYGDPVWTWSDDNRSATATFTCKNCGHENPPIQATVKPKQNYPNMMTASVYFQRRTYTDDQDKLIYDVVVRPCEHGTVGVPETAKVGDTVTLTVNPEAHYHVKSITVSGDVLTPENGTYSFEMTKGNKFINAEFEIDKVKVTWKNYDETVLSEENIDYGTIPVYKGDKPVRPADETNWKFKGWNPEIAQITKDTTYTAEFEEGWSSGSIYEDMVNKDVVRFNGMEWYIISDNSVSDHSGTVTLLAKDALKKAVKFDDQSNQYAYAQSDIKTRLDNMTKEGGDFYDVADDIASTDLNDVGVTGAKLYLLSYSERYNLPQPIRKCDAAWWLRNGQNASIWVQRSDGTRADRTQTANEEHGLRPALRLDLSKVTFAEGSKTFYVGDIPENLVEVMFDANGGKGTKTPVPLETGASYELPGENTFYAPQGQCKLDHWEVKVGSDEPLNKAPGEEVTVTATTTVKAIWKGHDWAEPEYEWSADNSTVKASRVCKNNSGHKEAETAETTSEVITPATIDTVGTANYKATFKNTAFTNRNEERSIPKLDAVELTLTGSAVSGNNAFEPYEIRIPKGTSMMDLKNGNANKYNEIVSYFTKNGYMPHEGELYITSKPLSEFDSWDAVKSADDFALEINKDAELYVALSKAIDSVELEMEKPAYGAAPSSVTCETDSLGLANTPTWSYKKTGQKVGEDEKLTCKESYAVKARLKAEYGYHFTDEIESATSVENADEGSIVVNSDDNKPEVMFTATVAHSWSEPTYTDKSEPMYAASRNCTKCGETEEEQAKIKDDITKKATCTEEGSAVRTYTFDNEAFQGYSKDITIPADGHEFGRPAYTWSDDNSEVTAERVCRNDGSHKETETVAATSKTTPATCTEKGETTYTSAEFKNEAFEVQTKKVEIGALGHDWGEWTVTKQATDKAEGVETRVCKHDVNHKETRAIAKLKPATAPAPTPEPDPAPFAKKPYSVVKSKMTAKGKTGLAIAWKKVKGASGYDIFFARYNHHGKKITCKKVKNIKSGNAFKWTKSGLKKGTSYKAYIKAYVMKDGKKKYVSRSPWMYAYTGNGNKKYTNAKSIKVKKAKVTLKKGKTFKIKAKVTKVKKGKKLFPKTHVATVRYLSSNKKIAAVSKKGKIKAKSPGTCYIYAYAHNGVSKKIKVTVK